MRQRARAGFVRHVPGLLIASILVFASAAVVAAHEERQVGDYEVVVGLIGEPVFTGQRSGLELFVRKADAPIEGLEKTLRAEVLYGDSQMDLPLAPRFGAAGSYQSVFVPTAAGPYTFHISGTIEGNAIDETFTSSAEGFDEVGELTAGQFPIQYPAPAELAADAKRGRDAAALMPLALGLGAAGALLGLLGLGVALAGRRGGTG